MLESVFIIIMLMGFVLFLLAVIEENLIFCLTSLLMWIIVLATHMYIEVPLDTYYAEYALFPLSLAFILINVIFAIFMFMRERQTGFLP